MKDEVKPPMEFLYRIQPLRPEMFVEGPTSEESRRVSEHFEYLRELTERGVVILAGRTLNTDPTSFGIVIFRSDTEAAARVLMEADPAVAGGVFRAELFPYSVALMGERAGTD